MFACATPPVVHLRTIVDEGAVVVGWVVRVEAVSACALKSSTEFSAANVRVVASFSESPSLATLLTRSEVRLALPPALPRSGAEADGSGV